MEDKEMSAENFCEILVKTRPKLFNHLYKECKLIYEHKQEIYDHNNDNEQMYWDNEELNIANAIVYDYGGMANKIGRIVVAATTIK